MLYALLENVTGSAVLRTTRLSITLFKLIPSKVSQHHITLHVSTDMVIHHRVLKTVV
jgi:hypothetical protein